MIKREDMTIESVLLSYIKEIIVFMNDEFMNLKPYPKLIISHSKEFIDDILGATAFYDIKNQAVTVYVEGRHPIDICKSIIHELVHHHQYLNGELDDDIQSKLSDPSYMANNPELLALEKQAYLYSGLIFRYYRDAKRASI